MLSAEATPPATTATFETATSARLRRWARAGILAYALGAIWRWYWIYHAHPPADYIYSDMGWYADFAKRLLDPNYTGTIYDTLYPPATGYMLAFSYALDPSWHLMATLQFLMALAIPFLVADLARMLFDEHVAWLSLIVCSLWFPFIDYAAYFMAETPFMLFMLLSLCALLRGLRAGTTFAAVRWSLLAGLFFAISAEFKGQALMPAALLALYLAYLGWRRKWKRMAAIQCAALAAALAILLPISLHVTRLNENRPVLLSTNGPLMFLTGHHGRACDFWFSDVKRNFYFNSLNPTHVEHGNTEKAVYSFGVYDGDLIMKQAWKWIFAHKVEALMLSFDHVADTFYSSLPWPTCSTGFRRWVVTFQQIFVFFIFVPFCFHLTKHWRPMLRLHPAAFGDLFVFIPVLGLIITVFITMGEPRYRIPFDGFLIILAARVYSGETKPRVQPFLENA